MSEINQYFYSFKSSDQPGYLINLSKSKVTWSSESKSFTDPTDAARSMLECLLTFKNRLQENTNEEYVIISALKDESSLETWQDGVFARSIIVKASEVKSNEKQPVVMGEIFFRPFITTSFLN